MENARAPVMFIRGLWPAESVARRGFPPAPPSPPPADDPAHSAPGSAIP